MIKLKNISKYYYSKGLVTQALRNINLEFKLGEFVAIIGESGSGKSTLLNVISGIDTYEEGELYINGEEINQFDTDLLEVYRKDKIAFIFQNHNLIDSYTVLKNVEAALVVQGFSKAKRIKKAKEIIEKVGLSNHLKLRASKLSGGEKQRLAIARALAKNTEIIIADEPTGNLDSEAGNQVLEILSELSKDKLVLIVSHNFPQVEKFVTRKIRVFDGEIVEDKKYREIGEVKEILKPKKEIGENRQAITFSLFNIFGQPKKSFFILMISFALVFFVFAIYSGILMFEDPKINRFDLLNSYPERLIVKKQNDSLLTDTDYEYFISDKRVENVVKGDSVIDMKFNHFSRLSNFSGMYDYELKHVDESKIYGRIPKAADEILISSFVPNVFLEAYLDYILNSYQAFQIISNEYSYYTYLKVVGIEVVDEQVDKIYITDKAIENLHIIFSNDITIYDGDEEVTSLRVPGKLLVDKELAEDEIIFDAIRISFPNYQEYTYKFAGKEVFISDRTTENEEDRYNLYVSQKLYNKLKNFDSYQYTINLKNKFNYLRVTKKLMSNGYYVYSPFYDNAVGLDKSDGLLNYIIQLSNKALIFLIILVVYLFSYFIYKLIYRTKIKDYTILKTLGASNKIIKKTIYLEFILSFIIAYGVYIIVYVFIKDIFPMLDNYIINDYIAIILINQILSLLIARLFIKSLEKKTLSSSLKIMGDAND